MYLRLTNLQDQDKLNESAIETIDERNLSAHNQNKQTQQIINLKKKRNIYTKVR